MRTRTTLTVRSLLAATALFGWLTITSAANEKEPEPKAKADLSDAPLQLAERAVHRRGVEAVIWGMPAVNAQLMFDAMKSAGADFNQVVYWSRPVSWKNQTLTPNPDTIYLMPFYNTKDVGPMVLEIPPAENESSINAGKPLDGGSAYRLHILPNAPLTLYWSATVYDRDTHRLIRDTPWSSRGSNTKGIAKNADGSIDVYFAPTAPAGQESNWVPMKPDKSFDFLFRLYGPEKPYFDKTWKLPDIQMKYTKRNLT